MFPANQYTYKVVNEPANTGQWKVLSDDDNTISTHQSKSAAVNEAKRLARNKTERTDKRAKVKVVRRSGARNLIEGNNLFG